MSFKCQVCGKAQPVRVSPHKKTRYHMVRLSPESDREVQQVAEEKIVCDECDGKPLEEIFGKR